MPEQPQQQPPPVQRLRIQYAKRGRLRFTSHRDFSRAFERALFRARVPMAYSSGFNPHPRISYAGAAPTGSASEAEYLEIALAEQCDPDQIKTMLDDSLPAGLDIIRVVTAGPGALADHLEASKWLVTLAGDEPEGMAAAITAFLDQERVEVERMTKKGPRTVDVRAAVLAIDVMADPAPSQPSQIQITLRHTTPTVRSTDVLAAIGELSGISFDAAVHTRTQQGQLGADGSITDPLAGASA